ncbi:YaeQ family protein [Natronospirillum operosum]|uniref:YaeQ family protein n=1 Tax=Natronospirillum operosum TaxID=2759953 RepID=A0A4Z0W504_9GAMM|nr:YaeQ family protein [Natronospirillum operosum]TGG91781.1 YaeQ family protein [Natronospirillum operosum]
MANTATIRKARLHIADMDRQYYQSHALTLAQHPSETDDRLAVRLLAFVFNASEQLSFSADLSSDDHAPELAERTLTGEITTWIAFGTPDEKWLRKAANRAEKVILYTYGDRSVSVWWKQQEHALQRYRNLSVQQLMDEQIAAVAAQVARSMDWQCNISDGELMLTSGDTTVTVAPVTLKT